MTLERQIRALAKLDGYVDIDIVHKRGSVFNPSGWMVGRIEASCCDDKVDVPHYITSYDAIIPLVQKQSLEIRNRMCRDGPMSFMSSPATIAERLLWATGKWTDE